MEDLKKIQEFFSKPLEEGKQLDQVDFAKVVKAVEQTGHRATVLLVPKFNEIEVITGMNAPDDMLFDLSNAVDSLGYGRDDIFIAADSSNLSRREYSDIRRVNGGHKDYFEESVNEAKRPEPNYKELVKLLIMAFNHEPKSRFYFNRNNGVVYFDLIGGAAYSPKKSKMKDIFGGMNPIAVNREFGRADHHEEETIKQVEQLSKGKIKAEIKELGNGVLYKLKEASKVEENALGMSDSRLSSDQHLDLDYAVRGDSAYTFGNDPYADDQLRYKYAVKMGFLEEYNTGLYYTPDNDRIRPKAKQASKSGLEKVRDFVKKVMKEEEITVDDATEFKLNLKHLLDKHVVKGEALSDFEDKEADYDELYSDYKYKVNEAKPKKGHGEKISKEVFAKLKGKTINYKGADYKVLDSDEAVLKIKHLEDGDVTTINLRQFNISGMIEEILETIELGRQLNEKLCKKGEAYRKKRMAAGEKSSAYLSGRAVKVCKGQMKG